MEENTNKPALVNNAIKNGVILGVISILITLVIYVVNYAALVQVKVALLLFAISIGFAIYAGINYRKEIGGFIPFGKAFQHGFIIFAISGLISTIFTILLYHVIDPELPSKLVEASFTNTEEMLSGFGMDPDQVEAAMEKARESNTGDQFTPAKQALGFFIGLIFAAIFALITGAIVKKNEPVTF